MATKTIKFKIINNLQINDNITYQIWKTNNTRITYANGITLPSFTISTVSSALSNIQLGATKEQTMSNIYNFLLFYNYSYTGLSYSYNGTDEITVSITNADGFEHRINCIKVPNNILVLTATPCSTVYVYNNATLYNYFILYSAGITIKKNGATYSSGNYPSQIDDEITRVDSYVYNSYPSTTIISNYQIVIPRGLTSSDVSHTLNNNSVLMTISPFTNFNYNNYYFNLNDGAWQTTRDIYNLLPNTTNNIDIIDKWGCKLDYPIVTSSLDFGFIAYPQVFVPVYNPMYYKFALPNFEEIGFRYLINLTNQITGEQIANFNIIPDIDGTGYIDVSKYLSNFTTVDFIDYNYESFINNCENSYIKYQISLGYEVNEVWNYLSYTASSVNGINYTELVQNDQVTTNTFAVGDQISVTTLNGLTAPINGLHTVLASTQYSVTIDAIFPGTSITPIGGSVRYSDNRKTKYNDVYILENNFAWNGALDWKVYKNYDYLDYYIEAGSNEPDIYLLTSLRPYTGYPEDDYPDYYVTPDQDFFFNFAYNTSANLRLKIYDNLGATAFTPISGTGGGPGLFPIGPVTNGLIRQFKLNFHEILGAGELSNAAEWYEFQLWDSISPISLNYRFYIDRRCKIEDYEILFMDRHGSLLSFAFPLRAKEKGQIQRDMYNKYIDIFSGQSLTPDITNKTLNLKDAGKTIYNVDLTKEIELNTNWMTDKMSVLFEELLTSPYTWIKKEGTYYPCIVKENSFEVERQKNKNLIRKTITVEYGNKNVINI
jgi:hypothetical protein